MQSQSMNRKALFSSEFVLHFEGQLFHPFLSESVCVWVGSHREVQ